MGMLLILLTGLAWGGIGIVLGFASRREFNVLIFIATSTLLSSIGAWIFLADWPCLLAGGIERPIPLLFTLVIAGIAGGMGMLSLQKSMAGGAAAWTVGQSALVIPFLAGSICFGETISFAGGTGVALIIFSLCVFAKGTAKSTADSSRNTGHWLLYAMAAFVLLGVQQTLSSIPSSWEGWSDAARLRVPLTLSAAAIPLLAMVLRSGVKPDRRVLGLAVWYASLAVVSQFLLFQAMDSLRTEGRLALAFPLALGTCILIVTLWDVLKWKRIPNLLNTLGIALGLAGVILVAL